LPFVHPFADDEVIAGQGTVALEVLEDLGGRIDALVVAVGGGGLLAGVTAACTGTSVRPVGVEPAGIPTLRAALGAGRPVDVPVRSVTASALGARRTAQRNLDLITAGGAEVVAVDDEEILAARDLLWASCRLAVEPAAAAPLAALLAGRLQAAAPCLVLCGANSAWTPRD
jgi:threonine dehydratase